MMYAMLEAIEKLLALQDKDQRLRSLRQELQAIPADIATKEKLIADSASRLEQARTRAKVIEVEKKTLQVEASSKREQIARYKTQQMQTRKNEEFTALAHEIAGAEKVVSGIEDKELALMEEAENLRPQIAAAEKIYAEEKARYDGQINILREKSTNLKARIADLEQLRPAAIEGIDEDLLERYERLFQNKNAQAVVALEHEVCMGCHMKVTSQTGLALRADKTIVSCPQCGRLLHLPA
ncbi:MAG: C4-type zinc ribbon domain-containing protein [Verrucomicrobia bacterium]|nr:C4-type zinc ribbon domain-containing protein [Verrucomicrobiota bacterium]